jgi:hypothetical protein
VTDRVNASFEPTAPLGADFDGTVPESASVSLTVLNTDSSGISTSETGEGGESEWSESENEQTISVANGRWNNISHVESITLSEGELVTTERCKTGSAGTGNGAGVFTECKFIDTLRLSFSLSNASDDYTADVNLEDCNQDGDFTGSCTVDKLTFDEERTVTIYDSDGGIVFEQSLDDAATTGILSGTGTDILAIDSYTAGSQSTLDRLKLDDSTWLTGHTQGRVTVTVSST